MWQVGPHCYPTQLAAAQAHASEAVGVEPLQGYALTPVSVSATAIVWRQQQIAGTTVSTRTITFTAQPCNLLTAQDAVDVGWGLIGAWVAVIAVLFLGRVVWTQARGETLGGSHDS